jgi:hexokinase
MSGLCPLYLYCIVLLLVQAGNHGHGKCGLPIAGFCFSFAMEQQALNSGKLLAWSKGFTVEGVLGEDVVALLSGTAAPPLG